MLLSLLVMSVLLGVSSFVSGILPLSFVFSKSHLERLSALATGLLLGTALGVIIPEGIESLILSNPSSQPPISSIALSLLFGFTFMLVIEQLVSPHGHSHSHHVDHPLQAVKDDQNQVPSTIEFDAELGDLDHDEGMGHSGYRRGDQPTQATSDESGSVPARAFPLTFGLIIHGLADGLALGVSSLSTTDPEGSSKLSLIVFLALMIHKAPTSLALTISLLNKTLPRVQCKRHLAVFSASTPAGAIGSYILFSLLGNRSDSGWTGIALLVSGGTFLYVATVLQPVSHHSGPPAGDIRPVTRVVFITIGMFLPVLMSVFLGHMH